jgi:hypothetical protein
MFSRHGTKIPARECARRTRLFFLCAGRRRGNRNERPDLPGVERADIRGRSRCSGNVAAVCYQLCCDTSDHHVVHYVKGGFDSNVKLWCEHKAIPNREAVDKLIRCEAAAERNLGRALDRLERLQRRRMGETAEPALKVNLGKSA